MGGAKKPAARIGRDFPENHRGCLAGLWSRLGRRSHRLVPMKEPIYTRIFGDREFVDLVRFAGRARWVWGWSQGPRRPNRFGGMGLAMAVPARRLGEAGYPIQFRKGHRVSQGLSPKATWHLKAFERKTFSILEVRRADQDKHSRF